MANEGQKRRWTHSAAFKAEVVAACSAPGVSVAGVALAHGLNANQVRRWLGEQGVLPPTRRAMSAEVPIAAPVGEFVPVQIAATPAAVGEIRIELRCGTTAVTVSWPLAAADSCGAWLRDWLR